MRLSWTLLDLAAWLYLVRPLAGLLALNERVTETNIADEKLGQIHSFWGDGILRRPSDGLHEKRWLALDREIMSRIEAAEAGHPRLRVLDEDVATIRRNIQTDPVAAQYYSVVLAQGENILREPPRVRPAPAPGQHILTISRDVLDRVYTLGILYRLSQPQNTTWLTRAWRELQSVSNFSDWNPQHYLDVAEMTHAVAIGYDWFYNDLSDEQRTTLEVALEQKGFQSALQQFKDKAEWTYYPDNWNNVCSGAMIIAWLAVYDKPNTCPSASQVKTLVLKALPVAMASYGPHGAWPEGVNYWGYATKYTVAAVSSLETALKNDFGLGESLGFNETALFDVHTTGPSLQYFNYGDAVEYSPTGPAAGNPCLFYLAQRYHVPSASYMQREKLMTALITNLDLILYNSLGTESDVKSLPRCQVFHRWSVLTARSAWLDPNVTWLGYKAGITHEGDPHGHLDVGSFVYETMGYRWVIDLGADSYSLPGYFGSKRFTYYRLRNIGHNTLTFDDDNQATNASSPFRDLVNCPDASQNDDVMSVDSDLTNAYYPSGLSYVYRQMNLTYSTGELLIFDRIGYGNSTSLTVTWSLHTLANITIAKKLLEAQLQAGSLSLSVGILSTSQSGSVKTDCPGASFSYEEVVLKPPQYSTKGVRKLMVKARAKTCKSLLVSIKPAARG